MKILFPLVPYRNNRDHCVVTNLKQGHITGRAKRDDKLAHERVVACASAAGEGKFLQ